MLTVAQVVASMLAGAGLGVALIHVWLAWSSRYEERYVDPDEVERLAQVLWDGYSVKTVAPSGWKELRYQVRDRFRDAARAAIRDREDRQKAGQPAKAAS